MLTTEPVAVRDDQLTDPVLIDHDGLLIAFARRRGEATDQLHFRVLGQSDGEVGDGAPAARWSSWRRYVFPEGRGKLAHNERRAVAQHPPQVRLAGMDLLTMTGHAPQPADASFAVVSTDPYLCVFRPSAHGTLYMDRFRLETEHVRHAGRDVTDYRLVRAAEVRYQRSGVRDVPASDTDTQSAVDMAGVPFPEPTTEFAGIDGIADGAFAVTRAAIGGPGRAVWYVTVCEPGKGARVHAFVQTSEHVTDFSEPAWAPVTLGCDVDGAGHLTPLPGLAPGVAFYGERSGTTSQDGRPVELEYTGRLLVAVPVGREGSALPRAVAVHDLTVHRSGRLPDVPADAARCVLADGTIKDGRFVPDSSAARYPSGETAAQAASVVGGLPVQRLVLGQVRPHGDLTLRSGEDGLVHLYYGGPEVTASAAESTWSALVPGQPEAMVAHYDLRVSRLTVAVPWRSRTASEQPDGDVRFVARQSGPAMRGATVRVSDVVFGDGDGDGQAQPDLCTLAIDPPEASGLPAEQWVGVPREVVALAAVCNGAGSDDAADPAVASGETPFFAYDRVRAVLRIPADGGAGQEPARLTLVSRRSDLPVSRAVVDEVDGHAGLALELGDSDRPVVVGLAGLSRKAAAWPTVLAGGNRAAFYAQRRWDAHRPTTAWLLPTTAPGGGAPVLVYAADRDQDAKGAFDGWTLRVDGADPGRVRVTVTDRGGATWSDTVPAMVEDFAAALAAAHPSLEGLRFAVSVGSACGEVAPQPADMPPIGAGSLLAAVVDTVVPAGGLEGRTVPSGTSVAGVVGRHVDPRQVPASPDRLTSFLVTVDEPESGAGAVIGNTGDGAGTEGVDRVLDGAADDTPSSGAWVRQGPAFAFGTGGGAGMTVPLGADGASAGGANLRPAPQWTLETWVKPRKVEGSQRLLAFDDPDGAAGPDAPASSYGLALQCPATLQFGRTDSGSIVPSRYVAKDATFDALLLSSFTWSFWLQRDDEAAPVGDVGTVLEIRDDTTPDPRFQICLSSDGRVAIRTCTNGQSSDQATSAQVPVRTADGDRAWTHVSVTATYSDFWPDGPGVQMRVYFDGVLQSTFDPVPFMMPFGPTEFSIGRNVFGASVFGRLAWLTLRKGAKDPGELYREALRQPMGPEADLVACWPLSQPMTHNGDAPPLMPNISGRPGWDAKLVQGHQQSVGLAETSPFVMLSGTVGGLPSWQVAPMLATDRWNHVAVTFEAGGALRLDNDGDGGGDGAWGVAEGVEIASGEAFAVDAWVAATPGRSGVIVSQWNDASDGQRLRLEVDEQGYLVFRVGVDVDADADEPVVQSTKRVMADGRPHYVAAVYADRTKDASELGKPSIGRYQMWLYADGKLVGDSGLRDTGKDAAAVPIGAAPLLLGRAGIPADGDEPGAPADPELLSGLVGRVRLWDRLPQDAHFPQFYPPSDHARDRSGLVAQWDFTEQSGYVAADQVGGHDLRLSSPDLWEYLRPSSRARFLVNGRPATRTVADEGPLHPPASPGLQVGDTGAGGAAMSVARLALWDHVRTPAEVAAGANSPLTGAEDGLLALWDFRDRRGIDQTGGGNDAAPPLAKDRCAPSDAPISNEGAVVRNVYGGTVTQRSHSAPGRIAVAGAVAVGAAAPAAGPVTLTRQYLLDLSSVPMSPVYVGALDTVYLGQQQTQPQLIGFIEGAPPVPSENLTRPGYGYPGYDGASSVQVTLDDTVASSFSTSVTNTVSLALKLKVGLPNIDSRKDLIIPFVAVINMFRAEVEGKLTTTQSVEASHTYSTSDEGTWRRSVSDRQRLAGSWEPRQDDPSGYLNPEVGRMFLPDNVGVGVVESLTVDCFALLCTATGAAVGTFVVPSEDIPPDRNLVTFPIDPGYTRNGTLDGRMGTVDAPGYPDAEAERGSYFKPDGAYALAAAIEQQHVRDQASLIGAGDHRTPVAFTDDPDGEGIVAVPRSGIVNRYVWTADGGLHAEAESVAGVAKRTHQGTFEYKGTVGFAAKGSFAVFGIGTSFEVEVSAGYELTTTFGESRSPARRCRSAST